MSRATSPFRASEPPYPSEIQKELRSKADARPVPFWMDQEAHDAATRSLGAHHTVIPVPPVTVLRRAPAMPDWLRGVRFGVIAGPWLVGIWHMIGATL